MVTGNYGLFRELAAQIDKAEKAKSEAEAAIKLHEAGHTRKHKTQHAAS
jgi:hypothetical protein